MIPNLNRESDPYGSFEDGKKCGLDFRKGNPITRWGGKICPSIAECSKLVQFTYLTDAWVMIQHP